MGPEWRAGAAFAAAGTGQEHRDSLGNDRDFSERHRSPLQALFGVLELPWHDDASALAETAARHWLASEHGQLSTAYTAEQQARALPLLESIGLIGETLPPENSAFTETNIICGAWGANEGRLRLVRWLRDEHGCVIGPVKAWCGQRLREPRDGSPDEIADRLATSDPPLLRHPWVRAELARDPSDADPWARPFATEYEVTLANAFAAMGPELAFAESHADPEVTAVAGVPHRGVLWERFRSPDGLELILLNAAARQRPQGPPRHTTASCAEEWLQYLPPDRDADALIISGNPHTERTLADVADVTRAFGRHDVTLHPAGASAPAGPQRFGLCLGEIARLLHNQVTGGPAAPMPSADSQA